MGTYVPDTKQEQQEMLREIGFNSFDEMFSHIPEEVKLKDGLNLMPGLSEQAVIGKMEDIAGKNVVFRHIFRGAGAYNHYIPAIVSSVISKEEFVTAYTPYQAEISQGILQSIFEYQTMICELTGMDASNASIYDGATAAAEAAAMCRDRKRSTVYVSGAANPGVIEVIKTYCFGSNAKMVIVPEKCGVTDTEALAGMMKADAHAACFYVQQPNYFGNMEDGDNASGDGNGHSADSRHSSIPSLPYERKDFAADMVCASSLVGHNALGCGNDCDAEALQNAGQLVRTGVDAQAGLRHTAQAADDLFLAGKVLQLDADDALGAVLDDFVALDVAFVEQDLRDCLLQVGSRHIDGLVLCRVCIADARQHIGNGISDLHVCFLLV